MVRHVLVCVLRHLSGLCGCVALMNRGAKCRLWRSFNMVLFSYYDSCFCALSFSRSWTGGAIKSLPPLRPGFPVRVLPRRHVRDAEFQTTATLLLHWGWVGCCRKDRGKDSIAPPGYFTRFFFSAVISGRFCHVYSSSTRAPLSLMQNLSWLRFGPAAHRMSGALLGA